MELNEGDDDKKSAITILLICLNELYSHMDVWLNRPAEILKTYAHAYTDLFNYLQQQGLLSLPDDAGEQNTVMMNTYRSASSTRGSDGSPR